MLYVAYISFCLSYYSRPKSYKDE